jgi:hypothetical protein
MGELYLDSIERLMTPERPDGRDEAGEKPARRPEKQLPLFRLWPPAAHHTDEQRESLLSGTR